MRFFTLGLLTVFALSLLAGCAKKVTAYQPKDEIEKAVAEAYMATHPDRVITGIEVGGAPIGVMQPYRVSAKSKVDKSAAEAKSVIFWDTEKKAIGRPAGPGMPARPAPQPGK